MNKKSISPVVATALLLVVAVISVVSFQGWFQTFSSDLFSQSEQQDSSISGTDITNIQGNTLYINNKGTENLTVNSVKVDGNDCDISRNLTTGIEAVTLGDCIENASGVTEIFIETDQGINTQETYISPNENLLTMSWCYQESPDESHPNDSSCSLDYSGTFSVAQGQCINATDGNWSTFSRGNGGVVTCDLYINYSKPSYATINTTYITKFVGSTNQTTETSFTQNQDCWNQEPIQLHQEDVGSGYRNIRCYNGTGWDYFGVGAISFYELAEEGMNWSIRK